MKKTIIFIILIISSFSTFSQPDEVYNQEFEVSNYKIIPPNSLTQRSKITFSFDLKMKHPFADYFNYPYKITPLVIYNGDTIFSEIFNYMEVNAKPYYKNENIAFEKDIKFTIPYEKINLLPGEYKTTFVINAYNDYHNYGKIYEKQLNINMPELFEYDEQTFSVSDFYITDNYEKFDLRGINISFRNKFKFYSHQIKGLTNNNELQNYYFYIELFDENTNLQYSFFENEQNFHKQNVSKLVENISFFIPYHAINLPKGEHSLTAKLKVADLNKSVLFSEIAETKFDIKQPFVYRAKLDLEYMEAIHRKYDKSNVFGRAFSKRNSNVGKGYPDIFWILELGEIERYYSSRNKNSFVAYTGNPYFTITDADPIKISVWDFDALNRNEFISSVNVQNKSGENLISINSFRNSRIKSLSYSFQKILSPYLKYQTITVNPFEFNGVSGIEVNFEYQLSDIFEYDVFNIEPFFKNKNTITPLNNFINLQENKYTIAHNSLKNSIKIFVPYYLLSSDTEIGFNVYSKNTECNLPKILYKEKINIPEINDISSKIKNIEAGAYKDIYGAIIYIDYDIPEQYLTDFGLKNFLVNLKVNNETSKKDFSTSTELIEDEMSNLKEFTINSTHYKTIFIPYYLIGESGSFNEFVINQTIRFNKTDMQVGKQDMKFHVTVPKLNQINFNKISLKLRKKVSYEKIFIKIFHGNNKIVQTEKKSVSKIIKWNLESQIFVMHPLDNIKIIVCGITEFGIESELEQWDFSSNKFEKNKKMKLKGRKNIKNLIIKK